VAWAGNYLDPCLADGASGRCTCRIGDTFEALRLWVEHCDARNAALIHAATALAENAAVARKLAGWARQRGDHRLTTRLAEEAATEDGHFDQIAAMLEVLEDGAEG